jgi:23S rRNA pseudouridine2605 synthase
MIRTDSMQLLFFPADGMKGGTVKERLNKYLARMGYTSRRGAEELMSQGRVKVNGQVVLPPGIMVEPDQDAVTVDGEPVERGEKLVYYALNKPPGYVCTVKDQHAEKTVIELVPREPRVYPVGRLDKNSRGLIVLTNDGDLANRLTHPSFEHEKEYWISARWQEILATSEAKARIARLEKGVELEDGKTLPAKIGSLRLEPMGASFFIILREGRNRQIRRMCEAVGLRVDLLKRVRLGKLTLGALPEGDYRNVTPDEII